MKIKRRISIFLMFIFMLMSFPKDIHASSLYDTYETIEFQGEEIIEFQHLLFAKLVYDNLDEYVGASVEEYVKSNPDLYASEIWKDSGITYESIYCSIVGDWDIYEVYNENRTSGFYGVAFKKDENVILAYRGSEMITESFYIDESNDWTGTDFKFAIFNELSKQFDDANDSIKKLKESLSLDNESAKEIITLTGHSLGGALVAYESMISGCYGYSFDGACGHVIDLVLYYNYPDVELDFANFCNYTDEPGYIVADMIQHTNAEYMYQVDRKTCLEGLNENNLIPQLADAGSHIIWSCVSYDGDKVFFTEKVKPNNEGYSYVPDDEMCIDIQKNIIDVTLDNINNTDLNYEEMLGALTGVIKDGRVIVADKSGSILRAYDQIGVSSAFDISAVMYGNQGSDSLYGYVSDDVLMAGYNENKGSINYLDGNLGNDTYIIDSNDGTETNIYDIGGEYTKIIFRNMDIDNIKDLSYKNQNITSDKFNQKIFLDVVQDNDKIIFYTYNEGVLNELGTLSDIYKSKSGDNHSEQYVVFLEGKGSFEINVDGQVYAINNLSGDFECTEYEFGNVYISSDECESIFLILNNDYEIYVSNESERVNLSLGKYIPEKGMVACERKYNRKFEDYRVYFTDSSLDDGEQGETTLFDGINGFFNLLNSIFG